MDDQATTGTRGSVRFRKLRIAWSVGWGILCLLMVVLWVRSNWYLDELWIRWPANRAVGLISAENCGSIGIQQRDPKISGYTVGYNCARVNQAGTLWPGTFFGFDVVRDIDTFFVNIPYWFGVLVVAAAAIVAPRLDWRFSLRTLLIAMTLVAVVLGLMMFAKER